MQSTIYNSNAMIFEGFAKARSQVSVWFAARTQARAQRRLYRRTYRELNAMSDHGLADLGFRRKDLRSIALTASGFDTE